MPELSRFANASARILRGAIVRGWGERPALKSEDRTVTFAELDALAIRYAGALHTHGIGYQDRVAFLVDDSPELVAGHLGAMQVGAVSVMLDTRLSARELRLALEHAAARVLFVDAEFLPVFHEIEHMLDHPPLVVTLGGSRQFQPVEAFLEDHPPVVAVPTSPQDEAVRIYSPSSNGQPELTVQLHSELAIGARRLGQVLDAGPGETVLAAVKLFSGLALGQPLMAALNAGAATVVYRGQPYPLRAAQSASRHRPDVVLGTPALYRSLLREGAAETEALREVRHYVSAGDSVSESLSRQWERATGAPIVDTGAAIPSLPHTGEASLRITREEPLAAAV